LDLKNAASRPSWSARRGCDFIPPAATATQRSTALWRQDPSGRDLYGPSRVRKSALPLPRRIVDGPEV
jgi:hypothetical protein